MRSSLAQKSVLPLIELGRSDAVLIAHLRSVVVAARLRAGRLHRRVGSAVVFRKSATCLILPRLSCCSGASVSVCLSRRWVLSDRLARRGVLLACGVSAFRSAARLLPLRVNGQVDDLLAYAFRQGIPAVDQGLQFGGLFRCFDAHIGQWRVQIVLRRFRKCLVLQGLMKWRRGESNPRPVIFRVRLLRV